MRKLLNLFAAGVLAFLTRDADALTLADRLMSVQSVGCTINEFSVGTNFNAGGGVTTLSVAAPGGGIPAASMIFVVVLDINGTGSVSDGSNTYTAGIRSADNRFQTFYTFNTTALTAGTNITYTAPGNAFPTTMSVMYASGIATASPYDTAVAATATGFTGSTPAISVTSGTPTQAGELIIGIAGWNFSGADTFTQPSGFAAPPPAYLTQRPVVGGNLVDAGTSTETYAITPANATGGQSIYASIVGFKHC